MGKIKISADRHPPGTVLWSSRFESTILEWSADGLAYRAKCEVNDSYWDDRLTAYAVISYPEGFTPPPKRPFWQFWK